MAALPPAPQAIGMFPQFFAQQSETLVLREKVMSLSGDSFEIKLANGTPLFRVEGSVLSISGRKKFTDMAGNHLFDICREHLHIHTTFVLENPQKQKIMEVKYKFQLLGSKAVATFTTSTTGKQEQLVMKGKWFDTTADIIDEAQGGIVVARINRKLSGKDMLFGQQTYGVYVAPGVDMAVIAALCICLDEKNEG
ncbi:DUF567-domain-containing protein [Sporormia fimetaria CBS 119925]|uniref:DUF567-domain-containing protein n=1 Tax=Sporormia fimetaria CBS 119925 TaxID=1340428 RepID=A0A6A6V1E2_9PLEO|nr:DUF567-domain-containing protein [Sporormia fimetaria CBS 119925]